MSTKKQTNKQKQKGLIVFYISRAMNAPFASEHLLYYSEISDMDLAYLLVHAVI